nr:MAG TPA: hypothetical protein [Caudoviricetes sp.]DAQ45822.1 MAG TPA: hypothetical protein [Caudoviricetes sp.]
MNILVYSELIKQYSSTVSQLNISLCSTIVHPIFG